MKSQKSSKSSKKTQKEVKNEDKKPPAKVVVEQKEEPKKPEKQEKQEKPQKQEKPDTTKKQTKDEKASKNSKTSKTSKTSKNVKIDDIEKKMLEGQDHIEPQKEELKEKEIQEKIEAKYEPPQSPIKEEERKQTIVKPRETYLKEKMENMKYNVNLLTNIQKEMENKIKNIMTEEGVKVGDKTKDLKKCMEIKDKARTEIEHYAKKIKYKEIKNLMDELTTLKINLKQAEENEKILQQKNEENILKSSQDKINDKIIFDKSQNLMKIRENQAKREEIQEKINEINYRLKNLIDTEKSQTIPNKERVKDFINNFERDKEIIEIRAKKYYKEYKERSQRKQNDLNQIIEKMKKEMEEKEQETKKENEEIRKKFKEKEKAIEKKQSKQNEEILLKYKPYINQKLEKSKKNYLYNQRYEKFLKKEEKYFQKSAEKNKEEKDKYYYKFEDIEKFSQDFAEKIENRKYEQEQKTMELSQKWQENKEKLPVSISYQNMQNEKKKKNLEEEKKNQMKKEKLKEFFDNLHESFAPEVDMKKRKQLQEVIHALEDPKTAAKKYTLKSQKNKRIIIKKRDKSKPSKFKWELKLDPNPDKEENYIKKPKKINLLPIQRTKTEIPVKKPDYLKEIINKRKMGHRSNSSKGRDNYEDEFVGINKQSTKWEKAMNKNDGNMLEKIKNVQNKVEIIEKEAEEKEKLLKLRGGIENNPELGKKVSNLIIDSIEAKINMLKKMNNVQ